MSLTDVGANVSSDGPYPDIVSLIRRLAAHLNSRSVEHHGAIARSHRCRSHELLRAKRSNDESAVGLVLGPERQAANTDTVVVEDDDRP